MDRPTMGQHRFSDRGAAFDFAGRLKVVPGVFEVQVMGRVKVLGIAAVIAAGLGLATSANAAPFAFGQSELIGGDAVIERVADGCGPGFHLNPWGHCRPNDRGYGYGYRGGYGGGPRGFYGRPAYGYGDGYGPRGGDYGYGGPRRFYGGY